jgi:hypothetical protein
MKKLILTRIKEGRKPSFFLLFFFQISSHPCRVLGDSLNPLSRVPAEDRVTVRMLLGCGQTSAAEDGNLMFGRKWLEVKKKGIYEGMSSGMTGIYMGS